MKVLVYLNLLVMVSTMQYNKTSVKRWCYQNTVLFSKNKLEIGKLN